MVDVPPASSFQLLLWIKYSLPSASKYEAAEPSGMMNPSVHVAPPVAVAVGVGSTVGVGVAVAVAVGVEVGLGLGPLIPPGAASEGTASAATTSPEASTAVAPASNRRRIRHARSGRSPWRSPLRGK